MRGELPTPQQGSRDAPCNLGLSNVKPSTSGVLAMGQLRFQDKGPWSGFGEQCRADWQTPHTKTKERLSKAASRGTAQWAKHNNDSGEARPSLGGATKDAGPCCELYGSRLRPFSGGCPMLWTRFSFGARCFGQGYRWAAMSSASIRLANLRAKRLAALLRT